MARLTLTPVQPNEALEYFRSKGFKTSFAWQDVWQEEHAKAFTVAKAMSRDILQDIRDAVDRALAEGTTMEQFRKELEPVLRAKGWWGKQKMVDPQTGEEKLVQLGSGRRLRTIFNTNVRVAYAAGDWVRMQQTKRFLPYLKYHHLDPQDHPRPEHQAWGGTVLHIDDPWWDTHYPPCAWGCHCWTTALTASMARAEPKFGRKPPVFAPKPYKNPRTGEVISIERGIDPGWSYNVGKAYLAALTPPPIAPIAPPSPAEPAAPETTTRPPPSPRPESEPTEDQPTVPETTNDEPPASLPPASEAEKGSPAIEPVEPLPAAVELPAEQLLDAGADQAEAQAAFLGGFGLTPDETAIRPDASDDNLVIGPALFRDSAGHPVALAPELVRVLPAIGEALRRPAEIRSVWREGPPREGGRLSMLVRRFVARFQLAGVSLDVVVDVANAGWSARTSLDDPGFDLDDWRRGVVLWPPKRDRR